MNLKTICLRISWISPDYKIKICPLNFSPKFITNVSAIYPVQDLNNTLNHCGMLESNGRMELRYEIYLQTNYDTYILGQFIHEYESRLVDDQRELYYSILNSVENDKGITFLMILQVALAKISDELAARKRSSEKEYCSCSSIKWDCNNTARRRKNCTLHVLSAPGSYTTRKSSM